MAVVDLGQIDVVAGAEPDLDVPDPGDSEQEDPAHVRKMLSDFYSDVYRIDEGSPMDAVATAQPQRFRIREWQRPTKPEEAAETEFVAKQNPTEFEQSIETEWNRFVSPGAGYSHMHFMATKNHTVELELYWNAFTAKEAMEAERVRLLLLSWNYPRRNKAGWSLGPPRLYAEWPNGFEFQCYLVECKIRNLAFSLDGRTVRWIAQIKLEEAKDFFIGSSVVRRNSETGPPVNLNSIPWAKHGGKSKRKRK